VRSSVPHPHNDVVRYLGETAARRAVIRHLLEFGVLLVIRLGTVVIGEYISMIRPSCALSTGVAAWRRLDGRFDSGPLRGAPSEVYVLAEAMVAASTALGARVEELRAAFAARSPRCAGTSPPKATSRRSRLARSSRSSAASASRRSARRRASGRARGRGPRPYARLGRRGAARLIITEAVTKAVQYAFPAGRGGTVSVAVRRKGGTLTVRDDGMGIDASKESEEVERGRGLGGMLSDGFARQLGATWVTENSADGTELRLTMLIRRRAKRGKAGQAKATA
jgi:nitrate/nitrite-specific signal transduction histidine kinase